MIDKDYLKKFGDGEDRLPFKAIDDYRVKYEAAETTCRFEENPWRRICSSRIPDSFRSGNNLNDNVQLYGFDLGTYKWMSILRFLKLHAWFGDSALDNPNHKEELFLHDPLFWQKPQRCFMDYFVRDQGFGSLRYGYYKYVLTMLWKYLYLVKMSFGIWDETLIEAMQIKNRSRLFDLNRRDIDLRHEDVIIATGEAHSLIWQFLPYCVFLSKGGEAFNAAPIFVYDTVTERTIDSALKRHGQIIPKEIDVDTAEAYPSLVVEVNDDLEVDNVVEKFDVVVRQTDFLNAESLASRVLDSEYELTADDAFDVGDLVDVEVDREFDVGRTFEVLRHTGRVTFLENDDNGEAFGSPETGVTDSGEEQKDMPEFDPDADNIKDEYEKALWTLEINDTATSLYDELDSDLVERKSGWYIQVDSPHEPGYYNRLQGMFLWFDEDSFIGNETKQSDKFEPWITIYQCADEEALHAKKLNPRHLENLVGTRALVNPIVYGPDEIRGKVGSNLPSRENPLYVDHRSCVVMFVTPGNSGTHAKVNAVYANEPPLIMATEPRRNSVRWAGNVIQYFCLLVMVFLRYPEAFVIWIIIAVALSVDEAQQDFEEDAHEQKDKRREVSLFKDKEAWVHLRNKWLGIKKVYTIDDEQERLKQVLAAYKRASKDFDYMQKRYMVMRRTENSKWAGMSPKLVKALNRLDATMNYLVGAVNNFPNNTFIAKNARHARYCRIMISRMLAGDKAAVERNAHANHSKEHHLFHEAHSKEDGGMQFEGFNEYFGEPMEETKDQDSDSSSSTESDDEDKEKYENVPRQQVEDCRKFDHAIRDYHDLLKFRHALGILDSHADMSELGQEESSVMMDVEVTMRELGDKGDSFLALIRGRMKHRFTSDYAATCPSGHPLIEQYCPYNATCDRCACSLPLHTIFWRCSPCMHDICTDCFATVRKESLANVNRDFDRCQASFDHVPFQTLNVGHTSRSRALLHMAYFQITYKHALHAAHHNPMIADEIMRRAHEVDSEIPEQEALPPALLMTSNPMLAEEVDSENPEQERLPPPPPHVPPPPPLPAPTSLDVRGSEDNDAVVISGETLSVGTLDVDAILLQGGVVDVEDRSEDSESDDDDASTDLVAGSTTFGSITSNDEGPLPPSGQEEEFGSDDDTRSGTSADGTEFGSLISGSVGLLPGTDEDEELGSDDGTDDGTAHLGDGAIKSDGSITTFAEDADFEGDRTLLPEDASEDLGLEDEASSAYGRGGNNTLEESSEHEEEVGSDDGLVSVAESDHTIPVEDDETYGTATANDDATSVTTFQEDFDPTGGGAVSEEEEVSDGFDDDELHGFDDDELESSSDGDNESEASSANTLTLLSF